MRTSCRPSTRFPRIRSEGRLARWLAGIGLVLGGGGAAVAHDFWIEPAQFQVTSGRPVSLRFLIGEPGKVEHWATEWRKVVSLQDIGPDGVTDLLATIRPLAGATPGLDRPDAVVILTRPGTHLVAFTSSLATSDLDAAAFNDYARHEGLALVIADRARNGREAARGRELYSRRAKALIQVGPRATDTVSRPIGQALELVPEHNPALPGSDRPLVVRVWFHGTPLAGASVVLEKLGAGAVHGTPLISDASGRVTFPRPSAGRWKLNTVWSYPIDDPRADYETIFASLSFGL